MRTSRGKAPVESACQDENSKDEIAIGDLVVRIQRQAMDKVA